MPTGDIEGSSLPIQKNQLLEAIAQRGAELREQSDRYLGLQAEILRKRAGAGDPLDELLIESFSLVSEAAYRVLEERPYEVQLLAGIALHEGQVIEMQTGEGKTLAAVAPAFLHALTGEGLHILTFNDFLARRDAGWMGPIYELLGCTVGCVQEDTCALSRRAAYRRDITYVTAKEAGFDLLRDQLCLDLNDQLHRPFHHAIVDEADSILIDEARIPLVIAGHFESKQSGLHRLAEIARELESNVDFEIDEGAHNVFLTERGSYRVEEALGCGNLFAPERTRLLAEVRNALHAQVLLHCDVDYLIRDGKIELVDELTGRIAEMRRWPDGLQPAVEAKENLGIEADGQILGSISLQHFLSLYPTLSGMTGTALAAEEELKELYGLGVTVIPTHLPCVRVDHNDVVFTTKEAKLRGLVAEIEKVHIAGQPVLVGTTSVLESESLGCRLRESGIACRVLNARNDEEEASIIAEAGEFGALTISTNMAGRGTDIRLGGDRVKELGGLYVIGTSRHESCRIDKQLRGRAGRQGDPGSTRFFLSLEDDLMDRFGLRSKVPERMLSRNHDGRIDLPLIRREIERSQRILEGESFDIRKRMWSYSTLIEEQRRVLGDWRQGVLDGSISSPLLQERLGERWSSFEAQYGQAKAEKIEQRVTLLSIDRCWSEHLADLSRIRDELHFVVYDGRTPLVEFCRIAGERYHDLLAQIEEEIVHSFEALKVDERGVDWQIDGLRGPSSTWTYLVNDSVFGDNAFLTLAMRPSFMMGAIVLWPLLFLWALYEHWSRWRKRRTVH